MSDSHPIRRARPLWFQPLIQADLATNGSSSSRTSFENAKDDKESGLEDHRSLYRPLSARPSSRKAWKRARADNVDAPVLALDVMDTKLTKVCARKLVLELCLSSKPDFDAEHEALLASLQLERRRRLESERTLGGELSQVDAAEEELRSKLEQTRETAAKMGIRYVEHPDVVDDIDSSVQSAMSRDAVGSPFGRNVFTHNLGSNRDIALAGSDVYGSVHQGTEKQLRDDTPEIQNTQNSSWGELLHDDAEGLRNILSSALKELNETAPVSEKSRCQQKQVSCDTPVFELARTLGNCLFHRHLEQTLIKSRQDIIQTNMERLCMEAADIESQAAAAHDMLQKRRKINKRLFAHCKQMQEMMRTIAERALNGSLESVASNPNVATKAPNSPKPTKDSRNATNSEGKKKPPPSPSSKTAPQEVDLEAEGAIEREKKQREVIQCWETFTTLLLERAATYARIKQVQVISEIDTDDATATTDGDWEHLCDQVAVASRFVPEYRKFQELLRQRCERWQEVHGLSDRLEKSGHLLSKSLRECPVMVAENRLQHLRMLKQSLTNMALAKLEHIQQWSCAESSQTLLSSVFDAAEGVHPRGDASAHPDRALWSLTSCLWALDAYTRRELTGLRAKEKGSQRPYAKSTRKCAVGSKLAQKKACCEDARRFNR